MTAYDNVILQHYKNVAKTQSKDESCTMDDQAIRDLETTFIINSVASELLDRSNLSNACIADYGCGNGFTLVKLAERFPNLNYKGLEYTPELREIANSKKGIPCMVKSCDIRDASSLPSGVDIVICQRVIINLLKREDQKTALKNIINSISPGGLMISIEAFSSNLDTLNKCRSELGLKPIPEAHHNLYLDDNFFDEPELISQESKDGVNFLSTHYFITRVLHDVALSATGSPFVRNSLFVKFFDSALPVGVGEFSPLRCNIFRKQ